MDLCAILRAWDRHRPTILYSAIGAMSVAAVWALATGFERLLFDPGPDGAIDLKFRYAEVARWFAGLPVYPVLPDSTYPPASYAALWTLLGWSPLTVCRWLWAAASGLALTWLARYTARESGAVARVECVFAALLPLALNAASVAVGNGQLVLFLLPPLSASILLLARKGDRGLRTDVTAAALFLVALTHPAIAAPFFWLVLLVPTRPRAAATVVIGYVVATLFSAAFQPGDLFTLLREWTTNVGAAAVGKGYADLHTALVYLGLRDWAMPASGAVLAGLGVWTFRRRRADTWLLLGVTGIVARLWTYHGLYDDVLILLPMIALFRIAKRAAHPADRTVAAALLTVTLPVMLLPARWDVFWNPPWSTLFWASHVTVWLAMLLFLGRCAARSVAPQVEAAPHVVPAPIDDVRH